MTDLEQVRECLENLVKALDGAFISSWQSTAAWKKELDAARECVAQMKGVG